MVTSRHLVQSGRYFGYEFDPECVRNLKEILERTTADIVVSSSWRDGRTLKQLQSIFELNGITRIIGMTPIIEGAIRGREIQEYIDTNEKSEIEQFVILDDEEEMGDLREYLIETDFRTGLSSQLKDEVISRLTRPECRISTILNEV
jgi:hypothetical protein